ncbi:MAG: TIGR03985 family CRISPR-associated protein [Gloeomargarita sp. SKYBB_i_bin120]|nr:TIGR03985 family CRISPR-associated protein [Gloeomargarita sp. SKYB120]MDW8177586.1 TIGR03985 family CRISPR-associated protein [Gloeomargarita sp. SKYBB_i_bin120]
MEFHLPLTVAVLNELSGYHLSERLGLAVRLWVVLHKLYGEEDDLFRDLPNPFSYTAIRDRLLSPLHPKNDPPAGESVTCPDQECICHLPLSHWIDETIGSELQRALGFSDDIWQEKLQEKPFGHSHRTLRKILPALVSLGYLKTRGYAKFYRLPLDSLPVLPSQNHGKSLSVIQSLDILNDISFMDPRLSVVLAELQQDYPANKRFFLHLDFILPPNKQEQVDDLQQQLNELWASPEITPVRFDYHTREKGVQRLVAYPVCLFYARRAKYLSAYGQTPSGSIGWHNFRMDRVTSEKFEILTWKHTAIPGELVRLKKQNQLPTPEDVELAWQEAWGTDFYLPKALMILRFEPAFAQRYIEGTERHPTFRRVDYYKIPTLLRHSPERQQVQRILAQRSPDDAYYQAWVRVGDTNLTMRLRDWRPNGEVIAPLQLREQMRQEAEKELSFYR